MTTYCKSCGSSDLNTGLRCNRCGQDNTTPIMTPLSPVTDRLEPCPFCGTTWAAPDPVHVCEFEVDYDDGVEKEHRYRWSVQCDNCTATTGNCASEDEAIALWNTRANRPCAHCGRIGAPRDYSVNDPALCLSCAETEGARHNARDLSGGEVERLEWTVDGSIYENMMASVVKGGQTYAHCFEYGHALEIVDLLNRAALSAMSRDDAGVVTREMAKRRLRLAKQMRAYGSNFPHRDIADDFDEAADIIEHSARSPVREDVVKRLVEALRKSRPYVEQAGYRHHDVSGLLAKIDEALSSVGGEG